MDCTIPWYNVTPTVPVNAQSTYLKLSTTIRLHSSTDVCIQGAPAQREKRFDVAGIQTCQNERKENEMKGYQI